jgi:hypothetical protein
MLVQRKIRIYLDGRLLMCMFEDAEVKTRMTLVQPRYSCCGPPLPALR